MLLYCGMDLYGYSYYVETRNNYSNLIYWKGVILNACYRMLSRVISFGWYYIPQKQRISTIIQNFFQFCEIQLRIFLI